MVSWISFRDSDSREHRTTFSGWPEGPLFPPMFDIQKLPSRRGLRHRSGIWIAAQSGDQALDSIDDLRVLGIFQDGFELWLGGQAQLRERFMGGLALFPTGIAKLGDETFDLGDDRG